MNLSDVTCSGCGSTIGLSLTWGMTHVFETERTEPDPLHFFCTPRCFYDYARALYERECSEMYDRQPDLLNVVAEDIFEALSDVEDFSEGMPEEKATQISEAWARLGHVIGQLNVSLRDDEA